MTDADVCMLLHVWAARACRATLVPGLVNVRVELCGHARRSGCTRPGNVGGYNAGEVKKRGTQNLSCERIGHDDMNGKNSPLIIRINSRVFCWPAHRLLSLGERR